MKFKNTPKVVVLDVETAPVLARVWGLWDQNVGLSQIKNDWFIMAFAAKEYGQPEKDAVYYDQRGKKNIENDKELMKKLWTILNDADYVIGQNSDAFDLKKINARFAIHDLPPPSSFRKIDTKKLASKHFAFTSNKLEYLSKKLNKKHSKSEHGKFPGMELWNACLKDNVEAWKEMQKYNLLDVFATEELFTKLRAWEDPINYNLYSEDMTNKCGCGSTEWKKNGVKPLASGLFQRYVCKKCGYETRGRTNLLSKEKRQTLTVKSPR